MQIVSFIAATSDSGKTTLLEKVVPLLKARGLRVAVIKHASKGFELDRRGKDSWRFLQAGADAVAVTGPEGLAIYAKEERGPDRIADMLPDVDIVLTEGFRREGAFRIEVHRSVRTGGRPLCADDGNIRAIVSDVRPQVSIPWFSLDDAAGVAAFICSQIVIDI